MYFLAGLPLAGFDLRAGLSNDFASAEPPLPLDFNRALVESEFGLPL